MVVQKTLADKLQWSFHYWKTKSRMNVFKFQQDLFFFFFEKTDFSYQCWNGFFKKAFPQEKHYERKLPKMPISASPSLLRTALETGYIFEASQRNVFECLRAVGHFFWRDVVFSTGASQEATDQRCCNILCIVWLGTCGKVCFPASSTWDNPAVLLTQLWSGLHKPVNWKLSLEISFFVVYQKWLQFNSYLLSSQNSKHFQKIH